MGIEENMEWMGLKDSPKEKQMVEDNPRGFWPIIGKDLGKMIANWEKECEEYKKTLSPEHLKFIERCEMCANNIQLPLICIGDQPPGEPKIPYRCKVAGVPRGGGRVRALCAYKEGK